MSEDRKRAAHAKEAKIQADREARFREKPAELRDAIREAERKDRTARSKVRPAPTLSIIRLREVRLVLSHHYGGGEDFQLPADDAGMEDAVILANSLARLSRGRPEGIVAQLLYHAPWMAEARAVQIARRAIASPTSYRADTLAQKLGVTDALRTRLDLRSIGATDVDAEARKARRKAMKAAKAAERRRANGAKPRAEYEAQSLSRTRPWESEGISRRTWQRRQRTMKNAVSQVRGQYISEGDTELGTHLRHEVEADESQVASATEEGRGRDAAPSTILFKLYAGRVESALLAQAQEASLL